jgi:HTH-type transcriptional regulator/antitoxin HigA
MIPMIEDSRMHWNAIGHLFHINSEEEYDRSVELLNRLIDEIGNDEQHPLYKFLDTLSTKMYMYEEKHHSIPDCTGIEMLRFCMDEHRLAPSDLEEIGPEKMIADILNRKQELTARQIRVLEEKFHVSPALFV